jgi:dTDP-4-dehydrorhamnose 3,5-epimerase
VDIRQLEIPGAFEVTPALHGDDRGMFTEWFRTEVLEEHAGHPLRLAQANLSVSQRGTLRGVHFADVPPSQAKYVTCVLGAVLDVVVDLRVGSPVFGTWEAVRLDDTRRSAVYLPEGLGHAFFALTEGATVTYLCSEVYSPTREHGINPLDPDLAIAWPDDVPPLLSPKDVAAPGLHEARDAGLLPSWDDCQALYAARRDATVDAVGPDA